MILEFYIYESWCQHFLFNVVDLHKFLCLTVTAALILLYVCCNYKQVQTSQKLWVDIALIQSSSTV